MLNREGGENWRIVEGEKAKIAYSLEFKDVIKSTPGVLKEIDEALQVLDIEKGIHPQTVFEGNVLNVTKLKGLGHSNWFKVILRDSPEKAFFLKSEYSHRKNSVGGVKEFRSTLAASQLLKDVPSVAVIEPSIAYEGKDRVLYAAPWNNSIDPGVKNLAGHIKALNIKVDKTTDEKEREVYREKSRSLQERASQIKKILKEHNFSDSDLLIGGKNAGYDPVTDTILIFDLNRGSVSYS